MSHMLLLLNRCAPHKLYTRNNRRAIDQSRGGLCGSGDSIRFYIVKPTCGKHAQSREYRVDVIQADEPVFFQTAKPETTSDASQQHMYRMPHMICKSKLQSFSVEITARRREVREKTHLMEVRLPARCCLSSNLRVYDDINGKCNGRMHCTVYKCASLIMCRI